MTRKSACSGICLSVMCRWWQRIRGCWGSSQEPQSDLSGLNVLSPFPTKVRFMVLDSGVIGINRVSAISQFLANRMGWSRLSTVSPCLEMKVPAMYRNSPHRIYSSFCTNTTQTRITQVTSCFQGPFSASQGILLNGGSRYFLLRGHKGRVLGRQSLQPIHPRPSSQSSISSVNTCLICSCVSESFPEFTIM